MRTLLRRWAPSVSRSTFHRFNLMAACLALLIASSPAAAQTFGFSKPITLQAGNQPVGVAVGDFNGDGFQDIVALNEGSGTVTLFVGLNDGTFGLPISTPFIGPNPTSIAAADIDLDGITDIAVGGFSGPHAGDVAILRGNTNGVFGAPLFIATGLPNVFSVTTGRLNAGPLDDLVAIDFNDNFASVMFNNGGVFSPPRILSTGFDPSSAAFVRIRDANFQGMGSIIVGNHYDGNVCLYAPGTTIIGNPPNFTEFPQFRQFVASPGATNILGGDFNNDGDDDIVIFGDSPPTIFEITGNASATNKFNPQRQVAIPLTGLGGGFVVGDFDGDGVPDFAVTSGSGNESAIFSGMILQFSGPVAGRGDEVTFQPHVATAGATLSGSNPKGIAVGDFNSDGRLDLAIANSGANTVSVYLNTSSNRIVPQTGWWWDQSLSGTGFFIETGGTSGKGIFTAGFLYDASGNATWLVSTGAMQGLNYKNNWLKVTGGQQLLGTYKSPAGNTSAGNVNLAFTDASHAVLTRPDGTQVKLHRFSFTGTTAPAAPAAGTPQSGWWWADPAGAGYGTQYGSGTGFGLEFQGSSLFAVAYMYDAAGAPTWYLATGALATATSYAGSWDVYGGGPQLNSREGQYSATKKSTATPLTLTFTDATHGTITMGSITIPIVRFQGF